MGDYLHVQNPGFDPQLHKKKKKVKRRTMVQLFQVAGENVHTLYF